MNIVSWNIACLPKFVNIFSNSNLSSEIYRLDKIKAYFEHNLPDIISLQEVFTEYSRNTLTTFFEDNNYNVLVSPKYYLSHGGLLIASKYKIIKNKYYIYKNSIGEDWFANKGILYLQVIVKDKLVNIFNTHNNSNTPVYCYNSKNIYKTKKKQIKEFLHFVLSIQKNINNNIKNDKYYLNSIYYHKYNISYLLMGDFNLKYKSKIYTKLITNLQKHFKICTNKQKLITDNEENTQVDYIINCYDTNLPYTPTTKTYIIENKDCSDHNILCKTIL